MSIISQTAGEPPKALIFFSLQRSDEQQGPAPSMHGAWRHLGKLQSGVFKGMRGPEGHLTGNPRGDSWTRPVKINCDFNLLLLQLFK